MKNIIFLLLLIFIICPPARINREERYRRKYLTRSKFLECILNNESTSEELKKIIKDNKNEEIKKNIISAYISDLSDNDREIIIGCRRDFFERKREESYNNEGTFYGRFNVTHGRRNHLNRTKSNYHTFQNKCI